MPTRLYSLYLISQENVHMIVQSYSVTKKMKKKKKERVINFNNIYIFLKKNFIYIYHLQLQFLPVIS